MKLSQGDILLMQHRRVPSSKAHFFLVLNKNPESDEKVLLLITTTSKKTILEKINEYGQREESCVEVDHGDCAAFNHKCYIDCNQVFPTDMVTINSNAQHIRSSNCKLEKLDRKKLKMIVREVKKSHSVDRRWKECI